LNWRQKAVVWRWVPNGASGFQLALIAYAICTAMSWIATPDMFATSPVFNSLARFPISENTWGAILAIYGVSGLLVLFLGGRPSRAVLNVVGTTMWTIVGANLLISGSQFSIYSPAGLYMCFAASGSLVCLARGWDVT
jgi:hypothetical protein